MAFTPLNFCPAGTGGNNGPQHATYKTPGSDTFATVEASEYFNSSTLYQTMRTGDLLTVYSVNDSRFPDPVRTYMLTVSKSAGTVTLSDPLNVIREKHTVTSAEVLALNATPQAVTTAPGAGKSAVFLHGSVHKPAGTAYAGIGAGEDLVLRQTNGSGTILTPALTLAGFADSTSATTMYIPAGTQVASGTDAQYVANAAIVAQILVGEIITGDSDFIFESFYRIVTAATS